MSAALAQTNTCSSTRPRCWGWRFCSCCPRPKHNSTHPVNDRVARVGAVHEVQLKNAQGARAEHVHMQLMEQLPPGAMQDDVQASRR